MSHRRIWTTLGENPSYKPPGASYIAQGPQKQQEILKALLSVFSTRKHNLDFWTWIWVSRPLEPVLRKKLHAESEFEVQNHYC